MYIQSDSCFLWTVKKKKKKKNTDPCHGFMHIFFFLSYIKRNCTASSFFCLSSFLPVPQCARISVVFVLTGCPVLKLIGDTNVTECHQHKNQPSVFESWHSMAHICYGTGANLIWSTSPPLKDMQYHIMCDRKSRTQKQNLLKDEMHTAAGKSMWTFYL